MKIKYKGIKGCEERTLDLGSAALLQGKNRTGKSTVLFAIHLALLGKLPQLAMGKGGTQDGARIMKAAEDGAFVELEIGEHRIRRVVQATAKKGKVVTVFDGKTGPEAEAAADALCSELIYADFRKLVAAGDKERSDILATYLPQPEDGVKKRWAAGQMLCHIVAALKPQPKKGKPNEPEEAGLLDKDRGNAIMAEAKALADANKAGDCLMEVLSLLKKPTITTADELIGALQKAANAAEETRKTKAKVAAEAAKAMVDDTVLAGRVEELEAKCNAIRSVVADSVGAVNRYNEAIGSARQLEERHESIEAVIEYCSSWAGELGQCQEEYEASVNHLGEIRAGEPKTVDNAKLRTLEDGVSSLERTVAGFEALAIQVPDWEARLARLEAEEKTHTQARPVAPTSDLDAQRDYLRQIELALAEDRGGLSTLRKQNADASAGICPVMGVPCGAGLLEFAAQTEETIKAFEDAIAEKERLQAETKSGLATMQAEHSDYQVKFSKWTKTAEDFERDIRNCRSEYAKALKAKSDRESMQARADGPRRELTLLRKSQDEGQAVWKAYQERLTRQQELVHENMLKLNTAQKASEDLQRAKAELDQVNAQLESLVIPPEPALVDSSELESLEAELRDAHAAQARLTMFEAVDMDKLGIISTIWKAAHKGASEGLSNCIQSATAPVASKITEALNRFGLAGKFHVDLAERSFGLDIGTKTLDIEALSGGEQVLYAAAMLSALPRKGGVRVLTLESAELDDDYLPLLLNGLDIGAFDGVVIASCHAANQVPDGWTVNRMGA